MPNGIFPIPQFHSYPSRTAAESPGFALRLRTRLKRRRLDQELSQGADPAMSDELTLRAAQLRSPAVRSRLAKRLVETVENAHRPEPFRITLHPYRAEIRDCAPDLLALVGRLRDEQAVDVRGMAMTALLLTPGASPLEPNRGESLPRAVRAALAALEAPAAIADDLRKAA